jgi:hypothetical protein
MGTPPRRERRATGRPDRRKASRGGRRATDVVLDPPNATVAKAEQTELANQAYERAKTRTAQSEAAAEEVRALRERLKKR